jgi:hypothetical protein
MILELGECYLSHSFRIAKLLFTPTIVLSMVINAPLEPWEIPLGSYTAVC